MQTNYSQKLENVDKIEAVMPFVLDMIDSIENLPSSNQNELIGKTKIIFSLIDLKDNLTDQLAKYRNSLNKHKIEFMLDQEGLAKDVS